MMKNTILTLCLVLGCCLGAVAADSAAEIKERMKERLVKINDYKARGILGENNKGYLEARAKDADAAKIANEENADRKTVYEEIGKKTKATVELVGKQRAEQIVKVSKKGYWLQDQDGKWYQKK